MVTTAGTNVATIDLDVGETVTCTFTNTQLGTINIVKDTVPDAAQDFSFTDDIAGETEVLGTINIVKDTVPDAAQDFSFTDDIAAPNNFMLDDDADGTLLDTETFTNVAAGTFTVTEAAVAGYSTTVSCVDPDGGSTRFRYGSDDNLSSLSRQALRIYGADIAGPARDDCHPVFESHLLFLI